MTTLRQPAPTQTWWGEQRAALSSITAFYARRMKYAALIKMQYRFSAALWLVGLAIEPVIYLVVWTTVAAERGGAIGGYSAGDFAAYYIVWTVVRVATTGLNPWSFEWRVRDGRWSQLLLRPMHPVHDDIAFMAGHKVMDFIWLIPIITLLTISFRPELTLTWWQLPAFLIACLLGFLVRTIWLWVLGLITFWTVRVAAIFDLYFALELILSGRVVPVDLLPTWARGLANWLPFQWSFGFPIEVMLGRLSPATVLEGFAVQLAWIGGGWMIMHWLWRRGLRRYSAVGA
jgi:ABC-2 type transport system permease protein